jgi:hypothetical protein
MKTFLMVLAVFFIATTAQAQSAQKTVTIAEITGGALGPGEEAALRSLVVSSITERGGFRIFDAAGKQNTIDESRSGDVRTAVQASADYVVSARALNLGDHITLVVDITKTATAERKSTSASYASVNELLAGSKALTSALFDIAFGKIPYTSEKQALVAYAQNPTLSAVAGTWDGDKGIHSVTLRSDGRGFALLDSGVRMMLKAVISGSFVVITQDQPNSPDFYRPDLDLRSATIVSAAARRWKWVFSLTEDGQTLTGYKESVFVKVDENGAVSVDNDYSREALWTRRSR